MKCKRTGLVHVNENTSYFICHVDLTDVNNSLFQTQELTSVFKLVYTSFPLENKTIFREWRWSPCCDQLQCGTVDDLVLVFSFLKFLGVKSWWKYIFRNFSQSVVVLCWSSTQLVEISLKNISITILMTLCIT